ncbi:MAG: carboxypeptidase regulatory-like domain-containing protein [Bacteroidetes bacterium]|nr:carboxypeptidase regulatory-like domain-containing protein [Bacteroidota bacterium]
MAALTLSVVGLQSCSEDGIAENGFGTIEGKVVVNGSNAPLANAKITTNPSTTTVFTDENGDFTLGDIAVGEYSIQAELQDYISGVQGITTQAGLTFNVVFELNETSQGNIPPLAPVLVTPVDNATQVGTDIDFIWLSSKNDDDPIMYNFELRNGANNEILISEALTDTTYTVTDLDLATNYFWQVSASDEINPEVESSISSFSTFDVFDNRFFFTRRVGSKNIVFSGDDVVGDEGEPNQGVFQLTPSEENSFRPRLSNVENKIAFLRNVGTATQIFTMERDGSDLRQVTNDIPVVGFRQDEVDFSWKRAGARIYYTNFNKLYSISATGTGIGLEYEAPVGMFITEVDSNGADNNLAIKINDATGYNARIVIINPNTDVEIAVVAENFAGALGGIDFSIDGTKVLYTRDVSGFENAEYRQLDSRIFEYDIVADTTIEIETGKPVGTNDLDAKYSPDEGAVIYTNTSNDGISQKNVFKHVFGDNGASRVLLFTDAFMPEWE